MSNWTTLGPADDFAEGSQTCLTVERQGKPWPVVLFRVDGAFHCLHNVCPHAGLPLGDGERRGLTITCPYHGYTYNLRNGADLDDPQFGQPATLHPTRVRDGQVEIDLAPSKN